jgi:hypothetical protein
VREEDLPHEPIGSANPPRLEATVPCSALTSPASTTTPCPGQVGWEDAEHADNTIYNGTGDSGEEELDGDPFVDAAAGDLALTAPTPPGRPARAPFDHDMFGTPRGADASWDRGALELAQ